jgi:hypothetical protein
VKYFWQIHLLHEGRLILTVAAVAAVAAIFTAAVVVQDLETSSRRLLKNQGTGLQQQNRQQDK